MSPSLALPVLADTSVWIDHFRRGNAQFAELLENGQIVMHEFVLGELVLGALPRGHAAYRELRGIARVTRASHEEVVELVHRHRLEGAGIGWVDAHLAASALIDNVVVWTRDKRFAGIAKKIGIAL